MLRTIIASERIFYTDSRPIGPGIPRQKQEKIDMWLRGNLFEGSIPGRPDRGRQGTPAMDERAKAPVKRPFTSPQGKYLAFIAQYIELLREGN